MQTSTIMQSRTGLLPSRLAVALGVVLAVLVGSVPAFAQALLPAANAQGLGLAVARRAGLEGRVLWIDGTANLARMGSRAGIVAILDRCVRARVNTVVVDVKPLSGHVLYDSKIAPRLKEWRGVRFPEGHDPLGIALEEGHRRGLKIYANMNVFSDGHKLVRQGPIYEKPDQQCVIYDTERTFTNPRGFGRTIAMGVNRAPDGDEIAAYDSTYTQRRVLQPDEACALVIQDKVEALYDTQSCPLDGIKIGPDSYMLLGRGNGGRWLLKNLRPADVISWVSRDVLMPIVDAPSEAVAAFLNPAHPVARIYELRIANEIVSNYALDGIVFDRMRYPSLQGDFSQFSREKFEEYLGKRLDRFPADVFSYDPNPGKGMVLGPYYRQWLEWRARNIRTWLEEASKMVRSKRPEARIGVYVGSWYNTYYTVGVNWGSEDNLPTLDWMSPQYPSTGYAHLLDWITTGCYHPVATREEAKQAGLDDSYTVQAAAERSIQAVGDQAFVYAGLFLLDYRAVPEMFRDAIRAARDYSHGVMIFDLSHLEDYGWWFVLEEEFRESRQAPHDVPELAAAVRAIRKAVNGAARPTLP